MPDTPEDQSSLREQIAEALVAWTYRGKDPDPGRILETVRANAYSRADAVLSVLPASVDRAAAEAYRLALSTVLRLGTGANWEAIRDRVEDLVGEVQQLNKASRRLLAQRQEMAAERFAWQERGDRAETRVRQLEAAASVDRVTALREEAARIRAHCPDHLDADSADGSWMVCHCAVAEDLERRLAVEAQQQTETCRNCKGSGLDPRYNGEYACPDCPAEEPAVEARDGQTTQDEAEDPARIDRLRPEFTEHSSVEAIDAQLRRARSQKRRWHIRVEWLISLRASRVRQKELGEWPAGGAQSPKEAAPSVPQCDGCGHLVHRARKCPAVRYGQRCECDEPLTKDGEA